MNSEELKVKKIGVLMGGLSGEREISLRSGRNCLRALQAKGYHAVSIDAVRDVGQLLDEEQIEVAFLSPSMGATVKTAPSRVCWRSWVSPTQVPACWHRLWR